MTTTPLLQVCCSIRHRGNELHADFESDASVTFLSGAAGSGKTILLCTIAGLIRPASGFIKVAGTPMVNVKKGWFLPPHQRRVGMLFEKSRLFPHLNAEENLLFGYRHIPPAVRRLLPEEVADLLNLNSALARPITELNNEDARRLALGRCLLTSPKLLLIDEPLYSLDSSAHRGWLTLLAELPKRISIPILLAGEPLPDLARIAERTLAIRDGAVEVPVP